MNYIAIVLIFVVVAVIWDYYLRRIARSVDIEQLGQDVVEAQQAYQASLAEVANLEVARNELLGKVE